jgi:hypothetical protein
MAVGILEPLEIRVPRAVVLDEVKTEALEKLASSLMPDVRGVEECRAIATIAEDPRE